MWRQQVQLLKIEVTSSLSGDWPRSGAHPGVEGSGGGGRRGSHLAVPFPPRYADPVTGLKGLDLAQTDLGSSSGSWALCDHAGVIFYFSELGFPRPSHGEDNHHASSWVSTRFWRAGCLYPGTPWLLGTLVSVTTRPGPHSAQSQ